ncbi:hypothetical protein T459_25674 [Capsicum annuum]|uniref:F-box/LRR-repeat protein 15/At3g58940/PEG3-like LRR domain-containing protein n=1 Tax=Capsicum annuum TaxID=4072 RepID=A0A2G2YLF7_CAPAN|nr:hypothetical protein T459_25674 [Capsicum annuum]
MAEKFKDFINWVLITQCANNLIGFKLCCENMFDKGAIFRWIHSSTMRNIPELVLSFCPDEPFELPYCVVTCGSLRVSKLELDGAILKMPNHFEFYQLKLLILVNVELSNEHSASCLFSRCSVLEKLIFDGPTFGTMTLLDITSTSLVYVSILNYVNNRESCSN